MKADTSNTRLSAQEILDLAIRYFRVPDMSTGEWVDFRPLPLQERLYRVFQEKEGPWKILVVKYRQGGCTWASLIYSLVRQLFEPNTSAIALAHYDETAEELFSAAVRALEHVKDPLNRTIRFQKKAGKSWVLDNGSSFRAMTAKTFNKVRLPAYQIAHLTEFAYYDDAEGVVAALTPALERASKAGCLIIESTVAEDSQDSYYYRLFADAYKFKDVKGYPYTPLFFPFFEDPSARVEDPEEVENLMSLDATMFGDEEELREIWGLDDVRLAWRRKMILSFSSSGRDPLAVFQREYPTRWEDAFLAGDKSCFATEGLDFIRRDLESERVTIQRYSIVPMQGVYRDPEGDVYVRVAPDILGESVPRCVAVDPSEGTKDGDPAGIVVVGLIDGNYYELASLQLKADCDTQAETAVSLAHAYGQASLVFDANSGAGQAFAAAVQALGYPHLIYEKLKTRTSATPGRRISAITKERIVALLTTIVATQRLRLGNKLTYAQMANFGRKGSTYQALRGHDDLVFALGLGILTLEENPWLAPSSTPVVLYDKEPYKHIGKGEDERRWAKPLAVRTRMEYLA